MSPVVEKRIWMQCLRRLCQGLLFTELLCAPEWGEWGGGVGGCNPYICLGLTKSNYWILDVQKKGNERGGIIHKILSMCVKIKVKIQRESASKTSPPLLKRKMDKWARSFLRSSLKCRATRWNTEGCYLGLGVKWRADYILPHNNIN